MRRESNQKQGLFLGHGITGDFAVIDLCFSMISKCLADPTAGKRKNIYECHTTTPQFLYQLREKTTIIPEVKSVKVEYMQEVLERKDPGAKHMHYRARQ